MVKINKINYTTNNNNNTNNNNQIMPYKLIHIQVKKILMLIKGYLSLTDRVIRAHKKSLETLY